MIFQKQKANPAPPPGRRDRGELAARLTLLADQLQSASAELSDLVEDLRGDQPDHETIHEGNSNGG